MVNEKKTLKFEEVKSRIVSELEKRYENLGITEEVTIIDGFVNQPFTMELSNTFMIGGTTIPMIMLVGKDSGRIYFFALKAIIKDIGL